MSTQDVNDSKRIAQAYHHLRDSLDRDKSKSGLVPRLVGETGICAQLELARRLQESPYLPAKPSAWLSLLGSGKFILLALCALRWIVAPELGSTPTSAAALAVASAGIFKSQLKGPRPYWYSDAQLKTLDPTLEVSYSCPSGHTTASVTIGGVILWKLGATTALSWLAYVCYFCAVGFSRVYTAAHFLHDVVFGVVLGLLMVLTVVYFETTFVAPLDKILVLATSAVGVFGLVLGPFERARGIPFNLVEEGVSGAGFLFGLFIYHGVGHYLESTGAIVREDLHQRVSHGGCLAGLLGIIVLDRINKKIYGGHRGVDISRGAVVACCMTYTGIVVWALLATPLLFPAA